MPAVKFPKLSSYESVSRVSKCIESVERMYSYVPFVINGMNEIIIANYVYIKGRKSRPHGLPRAMI